MTATACPHCGAPIWIQYGTEHDPLGISITYECGDSVRIRGGQAFAMDGSASFPHGPACRMIRALRVSQLKRMLECAESRAWAMENACPEDAEWAAKHRLKMVRLASACHRELDRLRAQQ